MKKIYYIILLYFFIAQYSYGQKRTIITGCIENNQDSVVTIDLKIINGNFTKSNVQDYSLHTKSGRFSFDFPIETTSTATLYINNNIAFLPGAFCVVINPGDSINFTIPKVKDLGLENMKISGRGAEKLDVFQHAMRDILSTGLYKKPWNKQTITEKYKKTDRYLSIIDSVFNNKIYKRSKDYQLIKAQLVDQSLDMLLYHSVQNYNDSVAILFNEYILDKKRIEPLLCSKTVTYFGGNHVIPDYMYLKNMDQIKGRLEKFRFKHPMEYSSLVVKEFDDFPFIKDFLLSDFAINFFSEKWDSSDSQWLYNFYLKNVDKKNPYYTEVKNQFIHVKNNLKTGNRFYNFKLPDTTGNIHALDDFRGKVIVMDFWFTGCAGCKFLVPYLNKVEKLFKSEAIQFISVNVDTKSTWKLGIGRYSSNNSLQLYTDEQKYDHPIIKFSKINAYPRLIVIDKLGNIVGIPPDPRVDFESFKSYISKYL